MDSSQSALLERTHKGAGVAVESAIQPTDQLLNELFRNLLSPDPNALDFDWHWSLRSNKDLTLCKQGRTNSITSLTRSSPSDPMGTRS
ncbi:hypothetical protein PIB30_035312 [Stylosanthes scabra]|uniref:Uncharacterized protein n=1 Tax=Stylosanthes scabra TaxID=79078 RepID=A0ABU6QCH4_9FABA|nr:hypothetical protein [Stylosanthes scabra]